MKVFLFIILVLTIAVQLSEQQPRRGGRRRPNGRRPLNSVSRPLEEPQQHHFALPAPLFVPERAPADPAPAAYTMDRTDDMDRRGMEGV